MYHINRPVLLAKLTCVLTEQFFASWEQEGKSSSDPPPVKLYSHS